MKRMAVLVVAAAMVAVGAGCSGEPQQAVDVQTPLDEAYAPYSNSPVVADGAVLERISTGHGYTEGPVCDPEGNLYYVDIPFNSITKISPEGERSRVTGPSGCANGLALDRNGKLIAALNGDRCVVEVDEEGNYTVLADRYDGKLLNNPNDLWVDEHNGIYFTDPTYYLRLTVEQDGRHVYYISPDRSTITRVADDLVTPNGIAGTPDNRYLYVADPGRREIVRYAINPDATLSEKTSVIPSGADGMTLDGEGNIYLASRGIQVYTPEGELIESIRVPESPANVAFGGVDRHTLYITARTSVYKLAMKVRGVDGL